MSDPAKSPAPVRTPSSASRPPASMTISPFSPGMRQRYQEHGYSGLADHRRGKTSYHRVPMDTAERVLRRLHGSVLAVKPPGFEPAGRSSPVHA